MYYNQIYDYILGFSPVLIFYFIWVFVGNKYTKNEGYNIEKYGFSNYI